MAKPENTVWVRCAECGDGYRSHRILHEHKIPFTDYDSGRPTHDEYHQLLQCMGCDTVRYRRFSLRRDSYEPEGIYDEALYPNGNHSGETRSVMDVSEDMDLIPETVWKMYRETIECFNAGARTLAGGGLRATVEAICLNLGIKEWSLEKKIDKLAAQNMLTQSQAELLHEERYIGNAALHELATPKKQDIEDGLGIVEGLINAIYILPAKANRLRKGRESKEKKSKAMKKK